VNSFSLVATLSLLGLATSPTVDVARSPIRDNYPANALLKREQGTVRIAVTIGADGEAKNCVVTRSSGFPDLDKAACEQYLKFVLYKPGKDDQGNPVEGELSTTFAYKLPG